MNLKVLVLLLVLKVKDFVYLFIFMCIYLCLCIFLCGSGCTCVCGNTNGSQRTVSGVIFRTAIHFFEIWSLIGLEPPNKLGLPASELRGPECFHLLRVGITSIGHQDWHLFYLGSEDSGQALMLSRQELNWLSCLPHLIYLFYFCGTKVYIQGLKHTM